MPGPDALPDDGSVSHETLDLMGTGDIAAVAFFGSRYGLCLIGRDYTAGDLRVQYETRSWSGAGAPPDWTGEIQNETTAGVLYAVAALVLASVEKTNVLGTVFTNQVQRRWRLAWRPNLDQPAALVWHYMRLRWTLATYTPDPETDILEQPVEAESLPVDLRWCPTDDELEELLETYEPEDPTTYPATEWVEGEIPTVADPPANTSVEKVQRLRWLYPRKWHIVTPDGGQRTYVSSLPRDEAPGLIPGGGNDIVPWTHPKGVLGHL